MDANTILLAGAGDEAFPLRQLPTQQHSSRLIAFSMEVQLIIRGGKQDGRKTDLALGIYLVGRSKACQIRPKNKLVSRKHCAVIHHREAVLLKDLGSKHGTYVNSKKIPCGELVPLNDGDALQVGQTRFRLAIAAQDQVTEAVASNETANPIRGRSHRKKSKRSKSDPKPATSRAQDAASAKEKRSVSKQAADDASELNFGNAAEHSGEQHTAEHELVGQSGSHSSPHSKAAGKAVGVAEREDLNQVQGPDDQLNDILSLLEEDPADSGISDLDLNENANMVDLEDPLEYEAPQKADLPQGELEEADGVDFAAPQSAESLDADAPVPSYQMRQDWDINSVRNFVSKQQGAVPKKPLPERKFKLKNPKRAKSPAADAPETAASTSAKKAASPSAEAARLSFNWLDSDSLRPVAVGIVGLLVAAWIFYNLWSLLNFEQNVSLPSVPDL